MRNNETEVAIKISGLKKMYRLGQIGGGTLQGDLQSWWARIRGREDPNSIIGQKQRLVGQRFMALNGINLTVCKGEAIGIIGSNGAGKSTLLKILSRVTAPTEGEIDIYGRIASMLEVGTGFNGEMTGRENVYMNGAILGMTRAEIDQKMEKIIEFSEVRDFIDTPVKRYSSGMYVKLAFSVAAHLDSEIMIMDEVLAVGDLAFQKKCLGRMREAAKKEGRTVLYVSHNMETIRRLCDRCIVLDQGKIIYDGNVEEAIGIYSGVYSNYSRNYEYEDRYHTRSGSKDIYLKGLNLLNKEDGAINVNGSLEAEIICQVRKPVYGAEFRFEIQYADGTVAGTAFTDHAVDLAGTGICGVHIMLDMSHLAPGNYKADLVVYATDKFGNDIYIDGVIPALFFEISEEINTSNKKVWLHQYWGHTHFKDIKVMDISQYEDEKGDGYI